MTNIKKLHQWMKKSIFIKSDYQKIRDLYFAIFEHELPFIVIVRSYNNLITLEMFKEKLIEYGFIKQVNVNVLLNVKSNVILECNYKNDTGGIYNQNGRIPDEPVSEAKPIAYSKGISIRKFAPKDGDIIVRDNYKDKSYKSIYILKGEYQQESLSYYYAFFSNVAIGVHNTYTNSISLKNIPCRYATPDECKQLFEVMEKENKRWNADKKLIECILSDKQKFVRWCQDNNYINLVRTDYNHDKLTEKLSSINMLCVCAKYLNGDQIKEGYYLWLDSKRELKVNSFTLYAGDTMDILFKTKKLALRAIDILGEDCIKAAFSFDY